MPCGFRKRWTKLAIAVGAAILVCATGVILTASHWWKKLPTAKVALNGQPTPASNVYRSSDGNLLVSLEDGMYIVFTQSHEIATTSPSNFWFLPGFAYSRSEIPPFALMNPVKSVDPALSVGNGVVEFNSTEGARVNISW